MLCFRQTRIGRIGIAEKEGVVSRLHLPGEATPDQASETEQADQDVPSPLLVEAFAQLEAYLEGKLRRFDLPLGPEGTPFMHRVWQAVSAIPYGATASYKEIAAAVGNVKAVRAVGLANNRNPVPIFIPCHRVIGSNGKLVGYGGGLEMKRCLLDLERPLMETVS